MVVNRKMRRTPKNKKKTKDISPIVSYQVSLINFVWRLEFLVRRISMTFFRVSYILRSIYKGVLLRTRIYSEGSSLLNETWGP